MRDQEEKEDMYASAETVLDEDKEDVLDEDKDDALEIAFSTYNIMVEEESIGRSLVPLSSVKVVKGNLSGSLFQWACQQACYNYLKQAAAFINDNFPDGGHKLILFG
eukprot:scaffold3353_cov298-Chaetoceros_neogracile.AAC.6